MKILGVMAIALTLGLTACGGKGGSSSTAKHKHEYDAGVVTTQPTCTEAGVKTYTCKNSDGKCDKVTKTETVPALGHAFADPDVKTNVVEAECEKEGSYDHVCTRCGQTIHETVAALEHDWQDATDQTGAIAPTCTEPGTKIQECSLCHQKKSVRVAATGHDFPETGTKLPVPAATEPNTKGEVPFHWAEITNYSCTKGDSYRYAWSAKEVNFDYANEGVHFTQEEIDAAQEGDPAYGKTTADWKSEPNLLDDGDGIRFWGRPIGNAMVLSNEGRASGSSDEKIPDETVKGSRFEFDFIFDTDVNDVCLSAELTPAQYTNDIFKNRSGDQEWTPGYRFVDDDNDPSTPKKAEQITGMRYIIYLDGVEVPLDSSVSTAPAGRGWYQFPCKLNLTAGKHNLNIAMAGGYLHTFYQFSFEKVAPAHEHKYDAGTAQNDEAESNIATCVSEDATRIIWNSRKFNAAASQVGSPEAHGNAPTGGEESVGITFSGDVYNKTKNSDPNVGDHAVYNVNVPEAQTEAQLMFRINRKDATEVFSAKSNDNAKAYTLGDDGKTTSTQNPWRYKLFINDVEVELKYADGEKEPKTAANIEADYTFPCKFALKQGVNKVELQKWGGYTPIIVSLAFVY